MNQYTDNTGQAVDQLSLNHQVRKASDTSTGSYGWSSPDNEDTSQGSSSTHLVSPVSDQYDSYNLMNGQYPMFGDKANGLSAYGYTGMGQSTSASESAQSYNNPFFPSSNNLYPHYHTALEEPEAQQNFKPTEFSFDGSSAALMEAAQNMFKGINYSQFVASTGQAQFTPIPPPTAVSTQALFQSTVDDTSNHPVTLHPRQTRSPSPIFEVDESSSPELTEIHSTRRNSYSTPGSSEPPSIPKRRGFSVSAGRGRRLSATMLDPEEKAMRAAAAEGLAKPDKRRMQNKLAQRAFRARSRVTNKQAAGRLEHLEVVTEQQADRITKLTELVGRLQKENQGLKTQKFQEVMKLSMP